MLMVYYDVTSVPPPGPCITLRSASYTCNMTRLHVWRCPPLICQNLPTVFNVSKIRLTLHNYATIQHFNISNILKTQSIIRLCIYSPVLFWFKYPIQWIQYTIFSVHQISHILSSHIFVFNKYNKFNSYSTNYTSHSQYILHNFINNIWMIIPRLQTCKRCLAMYYEGRVLNNIVGKCCCQTFLTGLLIFLFDNICLLLSVSLHHPRSLYRHSS